MAAAFHQEGAFEIEDLDTLLLAPAAVEFVAAQNHIEPSQILTSRMLVLGDDLDRPYVVRKIIIEKVKKTKRGKVTMCHLHMNRADNGCSESITLNICHKDSYYRDDGRRHFWAKTKSGFHPVICVEKAIFKKSFEEFVAGY